MNPFDTSDALEAHRRQPRGRIVEHLGGFAVDTCAEEIAREERLADLHRRQQMARDLGITLDALRKRLERRR